MRRRGRKSPGFPFLPAFRICQIYRGRRFPLSSTNVVFDSEFPYTPAPFRARVDSIQGISVMQAFSAIRCIGIIVLTFMATVLFSPAVYGPAGAVYSPAGAVYSQEATGDGPAAASGRLDWAASEASAAAPMKLRRRCIAKSPGAESEVGWQPGRAVRLCNRARDGACRAEGRHPHRVLARPTRHDDHVPSFVRHAV